MWRIFDPWKNGTACGWRKIHNEVLNDLYCSPKIFRLIKSRRIKWVGHVACMGDWRVLYMALGGGDLRKTFLLGESNLNGDILLIWIFRKWDVAVCPESRWHRIGRVDGRLWKRKWKFRLNKSRKLLAWLRTG